MKCNQDLRNNYHRCLNPVQVEFVGKQPEKIKRTIRLLKYWIKTNKVSHSLVLNLKPMDRTPNPWIEHHTLFKYPSIITIHHLNCSIKKKCNTVYIICLPTRIVKHAVRYGGWEFIYPTYTSIGCHFLNPVVDLPLHINVPQPRMRIWFPPVTRGHRR